VLPVPSPVAPNVSVTCAVARRAATVAINTCEGRRPATHGDVGVTVARLYARGRVRVGCNVIQSDKEKYQYTCTIIIHLFNNCIYPCVCVQFTK